MILADKIIRMRKRNGWSQEELAEKLGVSRQAVSKWEGAQTVPDIDKILQLARLFGVTTDYLLKDELEEEEFSEGEEATPARRVSLSEANEYLLWRKSAAAMIAAATFLWFLAIIPLITLTATEVRLTLGISEQAAVFIGLAVLFVTAAAAVAIYILCGFKNAPYAFLDTDLFDVEYGVVGMVKEKQKAYRITYISLNIIGVALCILSPLSLFASVFAHAANKEIIGVIALDFTLLMVGVGVLLFILAGVREGSHKRLLSEREFSQSGKRKTKLEETVGAIYWPIIVAIYLGVSFLTGAWHITWVVWPVAAVLGGAIIAVCNRIFGIDEGEE